jgi:hypothetical protein
MEKVTAVQWCAGKLGDLEFYNSIGNFTAIEYIEEKIKIIEEAKEMEEEQNQFWWSKGWHEGHLSTLQENTETFKSE